MAKGKISLFWLAISLGTLACEPEKLDRGKEMAVEAERHKVKRITQEDMEKQALAVGDTIVSLIEGAFLQLAESQPKEQELFVAQPDKLPMVSSILRRYNATLQRQEFASQAEAQKYFSDKSSKKPVTTVELKVADQKLLYQRPISIRRRNCASCDEPSLLDFTAKELSHLRVASTQGKPDGFEEGQIQGVWRISFPRQKVIEQITLKTKVSKRGRGGFLGAQPDTINQKP